MFHSYKCHFIFFLGLGEVGKPKAATFDTKLTVTVTHSSIVLLQVCYEGVKVLFLQKYVLCLFLCEGKANQVGLGLKYFALHVEW